MDEEREPDAEPQAQGRPGKPAVPEENEARVVGRLVNPPKLREGTTAKGSPYKMARLMLAVNRTYKGIRETDFIPVVLWDALAEAVGRAGKGTALRVEGRIKTHQVEGKEYRWELRGEILQVLDLRPPAGPGSEDEPQKDAESDTPEKQQEELLAS